MTCSRPMRRTGPLGVLITMIFFEISGFSFSAVRVMEMALQATEILPAIMALLLEEGSQLKTSSVIVSSYRALTNLTASSVSLEFRTTLPSLSGAEDPEEYNVAPMALLGSGS